MPSVIKVPLEEYDPDEMNETTTALARGAGDDVAPIVSPIKKKLVVYSKIKRIDLT